MSLKPPNYNDPLYQLLRDGNVKEFNARKAKVSSAILPPATCAAGSARWTRSLDFSNITSANATCAAWIFQQLSGSASINGAKISALFFRATDGTGITLSLLHGTRMRYKAL